MSVRISKFLSLVLRHDPARIGLQLDEAGWASVDALLAAAAAHGVALTRDGLRELVAASDKQRFALSPDGARIRANQGHSVDVDLQLPPREPPERLYHGTVDAALDGIREQGLLRGQRRHVHLSADVPTAERVGRRRGAPVILTVRAADMHAAGHTFYCSENGVWLTEQVPARFILWRGPKGTGSVSRGAKVQIARQTLEACDAGAYTSAAGEPVSIREALEAAKDGTVLHDLERGGLGGRAAAGAGAGAGAGAATRVEVTSETTIEAVVRLAAEPGGHLACLNYASAKNPGGGFLGGAQAQEESLARSSGLYPCLLTQPDHYARNRANPSVIYHDLAIFSPHVPFFRDDDGGWLERPVLASVLTCAAPNASALRQQKRFDAGAVERALRQRAAFVLAVVAHHGVRRLVLGAWGAGVFGNDPAVVASAFREPLGGDFAGAFDEVVFAVPRGPNQPAFLSAFGVSRR
ncbi:MAG TPA: RNA 2'-phosphotransferase [Kofleriaceae bacterium]|nr:RNA 2'-phosphotransferase [Kofleriaceae bacterium]